MIKFPEESTPTAVPDPVGVVLVKLVNFNPEVFATPLEISNLAEADVVEPGLVQSPGARREVGLGVGRDARIGPGRVEHGLPQNAGRHREEKALRPTGNSRGLPRQRGETQLEESTIMADVSA